MTGLYTMYHRCTTQLIRKGSLNNQKKFGAKQKVPRIVYFNTILGAFHDPSGIRTPDTLLKRQVLCRLS